MINTLNIAGVLNRIAPEKVAGFLSRKGFECRGVRGDTAVFVRYGEVLVAPTRQDSSDYPRRLRDLLELFVDDTTSLDDVVGTVVLPDSDIVRYRVQTPEATWGHLRLHYTHEAMHALYDLLRYSAAGVSTRRADYRRISESAALFANQCQFGQTEFGSFVLKVFCPTSPAGTPAVEEAGFGRTATKAVVENLAFLASERADIPEEPLPPTLNRQVAKAVLRLNPRTDLWAETEFRVRYSPVPHDRELEADVPIPEFTTLQLGPFIYSRAQSVRDRLKKALEFERELLRGYIVHLQKDPPTAHEQSHQITLQVKVGASPRMLKVRLLPKDYRRAVQWHDENLQVDIDAVVDKRATVWSVAELIDLQPTDRSKRGPGLFH